MKIWKRFGKQLEVKKAETVDHVAIFGYAEAQEGDQLYQSVINVTKRLAGVGYTIVDGGGPGVMRAATVGAKQAGGKAVAVTFYPHDMPSFEGRDPKNHFDQEIKTKNYVERTLTLMKEGQVYVVFNGGTGTISEFGMAWGLAKLYFGHHKPLVLYGKFWENIINAFKKNMMVRDVELKVFKIVSTPDGVLNAILEFEKEIAAGEQVHLKTTRGEVC